MTQPALATPERIALDAALAEINALNALTVHLSSCATCRRKGLHEIWWDYEDCPIFTALLDRQSETCERLRDAETALSGATAADQAGASAVPGARERGQRSGGTRE